jgi:hypothetical protein
VGAEAGIEVTAGVRRVVAAIPFLMDVKSVNAGRNAGQVNDHFDITVADIIEVHRTAGGLATGRRQRGHRRRTFRVSTCTADQQSEDEEP